ncbi:MAG: formate dehydrogenase accessory sulfurtransferase FdhD [Pseudomonadota bacterium]
MSKRLTRPDLYIVPPPKPTPLVCETLVAEDETGAEKEVFIVNEKPLTVFLNAREVVTAMTIGDHPEWLALGFLANQAMLEADNPVTAVDFDDELGVVVVRTEHPTNFEAAMQKRVRTSGCAQGTVFADVMDHFETRSLEGNATAITTAELSALTAAINTTPSLYLEAGAIHGTVLCTSSKPLVFMEDVGRHNAVDKVAGWMHQTGTTGADKMLYTTGRLTSEMVIKTVMMGIPILVSRSGFTASGVQLARQAGLTLIGRARGERYLAMAHPHRLIRTSASQVA